MDFLKKKDLSEPLIYIQTCDSVLHTNDNLIGLYSTCISKFRLSLVLLSMNSISLNLPFLFPKSKI